MIVMRTLRKLWKSTILIKQEINMIDPILYFSMNLLLIGVYVLISSFEDNKDISITSKTQKEADNIYI